MKFLLIISFVILVQVGFGQKYKSVPEQLYKVETLPGTAKIDSNLYIDYTEVTNFSYIEYLYWLERVFGNQSKEVKEAMPDTFEWRYSEKCFYNLDVYYLRHPDYRDFPVVGLNQEQARNFCTWRSDRVFELLMIKMHIVEHNPAQTKENYFSIGNYFKGIYYLEGDSTPVKPNKEYLYIPVYRLPNEIEWKQGNHYFDKTNTIKTCKNKWCDYHINKNDTIVTIYNISPCVGDSIKTFPMKTVMCDKNQNMGIHFYGNAAEWLNEPNMHIGGSWKDSTTNNFGKPTLQANEDTKEDIGFRCVAEWKKLDFNELTNKSEIDETIKEIFGNRYNYTTIGYSKPNDIFIDTSIYIDFTSTVTQLDSLMNSKALLDYYNLLTPPPHGGDPNYATIAVVVDVTGKAIYTHVVEDVKNKCNDDPWKLSTNKEITFSPLIINGKLYITEYVFKIMDLMYCVPLVYKETTKRKTFSFSDTAFEVGSIHQIKMEYSYGHPPLYTDKNQLVYDSIADFLKRNPNVKIEVSSHTDQRGTDRYNLLLSERRAENIMKQVLKLGIDSNQITSVGYGEEKPIIKLEDINKMTTSDEKEVAYAVNRRTELVITSIRKE